MSTKGTRDFRPAYHFTPQKNWINDPNGMVYVDGKWHLFYQHYPEDTKWGPMHWGHALSEDLVNWQHLPIALAPDELGLIFSGSAVLDVDNRSGFGAEGQAPIVAMYTSAARTGQQQSIAWSLDGVHFEKYAGNPVVANTEKRDFRDPKIFWNDHKNCFGMVLAAGDRVEFYASDNLKEWEQTGEFTWDPEQADCHEGSCWDSEAVWECPDLFPMICEETGERKWILLVSKGAEKEKRIGSCTWYFVGDFDGSVFVSETVGGQIVPPQLLDHGYDNYAGVTWSGSEKQVFLGWANNWLYADQLPTGEFCGQMTFARELKLEKGPSGWLLAQSPMIHPANMPELQELTLSQGKGRQELSSEVLHLSVKAMKNGESIRLYNTLGQWMEIGINGESRLYVDRRGSLPGWREAVTGGEGPGSRTEMEEKAFSPVFASETFGMAVSSPLSGPDTDLEIYWDHSVLEVYGDGGCVALTMLAYPDEPYTYVERGRDIQLAVFDMDGLMFDSENLFFRFYQEVAPEFGYEITREFYLQTVGCNARRVREITLGLLGEDFPLDEVAGEVHRRIAALLETEPIPVKPGLRELLQYLAQQKIPCVVASSSSVEQIRKYLRSADVEQYFTAIVSGNQIIHSKPEPDIFLKACRDQGVAPENALVLEDSQYGVLAAWRAGMSVACVPDMKYPAPEYAAKTTRICRDLLEVKNWLETERAGSK